MCIPLQGTLKEPVVILLTLYDRNPRPRINLYRLSLYPLYDIINLFSIPSEVLAEDFLKLAQEERGGVDLYLALPDQIQDFPGLAKKFNPETNTSASITTVYFYVNFGVEKYGIPIGMSSINMFGVQSRRIPFMPLDLEP